VLIAFLHESIPNQEEFAASRGFMPIDHLLSNAQIQHFTVEVIDLFKALYSGIVVSQFAQQMLEYIFLEFRLWIYLPIELQLHVY
jgi:hypothetical protein